MRKTPLKRMTPLRSSTPLVASGELKRKTWLRPVSDRQRRKNAERRVALEAAFGPREVWRCLVRDRPAWLAFMGPCLGPVNGHELLKRGQGGSITDVRNIVMLCNHHNGWVEDNPDAATSLGLVIHPSK